MKSKPISSFLISSHLAFFFAVCGPAVAEKPPRKTETGRVLYDFDQPEANEGWRIVTDGVMGGMSSSKLTISDGGLATFSAAIPGETRHWPLKASGTAKLLSQLIAIGGCNYVCRSQWRILS